MADGRFSHTSRRDFLMLAGGGITAGAMMTSPFPALAQDARPLKLGTIGAGREGGALGTLFTKAGHPVMFSSRNPDKLADLVASAGPTAQAGTVEQAVGFADVILLVVPYTAIEQIGKDHGKVLATKRLVMDVSNPIARRDGEEIVKWANEQGGPGLATAKLLPGARLVRAFNAINYARLAEDAHRQSEPVGVPIAGDDREAVALAESLIKEIGFEPVLVGGLAMGKYLVPGTPLAGEHPPQEIRKIAESLK
jgi:predicted dinucleotide-binding enzyme